MNNIYYDIESLKSIFTLALYDEKTDVMEIYLLLDRPDRTFTNEQMSEISNEIYRKNLNFKGSIRLYNLYDEAPNVRLAEIFGCDSDMYTQTGEWKDGFLPRKYNKKLVRDIDPEYNEDIHPYLLGYNSMNYDQTMLAMYFSEIFYSDILKTDSTCLGYDNFSPTRPSVMREKNDELFSPKFIDNMPDRLKWEIATKEEQNQYFSSPNLINMSNQYYVYKGWTPTNPAYYIRQNQINSGRHIDVARLNEKQIKIGLKRLLGMLGYQILEADIDLSSNADDECLSFDEIKALIAYNVSDVINLKFLFHDKNYESKFNLKKQMLRDYPELIYQKMPDKYKPDLTKPRPNRFTINTTSAQIAARCLCPYGNLSDIPAVSFNYPSEEKAAELGIPVTNILQDTINFINTRMKPLVKDEEGQAIIDALNKMIDIYGSIEGKNFNSGLGEDADVETYNLTSIAEKINVPYMGPDGRPTSCYVTFSTGGIHGAEYNKELYEKDLAEYNRLQNAFEWVRNKYEDPLKLAFTEQTSVNKKDEQKTKLVKREFVNIEGTDFPVKLFLQSGYTTKNAQWNKKLLKKEKPEVFKTDSKGNSKIQKKYVLTSFGKMNHEDFTSYYPFLLINMSAFKNPSLGYDRYYEIFGNKDKFGKLMKDKSLPQEERDTYKKMREGTKLILNSASGAADTEHNNSIRMNNKIISMRIIGQLFTWRIGQAQSLKGAKVPSTNTDGLYTIMNEALNNSILESESQSIHVNIEPEVTFLVSKDANNRFEGNLAPEPTGHYYEDIQITSASGGTLACLDGPDMSKSLSHPAIQDWALAEMLKYKALNGKLDTYDLELGLSIYERALTSFDTKTKLLIMFQNVLAGNPSNGTYNFATTEPMDSEMILTNLQDPDYDFKAKIKPMQHYDRVFYVDPEKIPEEYKNQIVYLQAAYIRTEQTEHHPIALYVIKELNNNTAILRKGVARLKKIPGIEITQPCIIYNKDLYTDTWFDVNWLDLKYYNQILSDTYTDNWQNEGEPASKFFE